MLKTPCKSRCGEVLARLHKFFGSDLPFESYLKQEMFLYKPLLWPNLYLLKLSTDKVLFWQNAEDKMKSSFPRLKT